MLIFSVPHCSPLHFCHPQDHLKRANGVPLALMKPLIDAIEQKSVVRRDWGVKGLWNPRC